MYDTSILLMKFNLLITIVGIDDLNSSLVHKYMYLCAFRWKIIQILVPNPVSFFFIAGFYIQSTEHCFELK